MNIEKIKIHNCINNNTIFNTDEWVRYEDFQSQQKRIEELEDNLQSNIIFEQENDNLIKKINNQAIMIEELETENRQFKGVNNALTQATFDVERLGAELRDEMTKVKMCAKENTELKEGIKIILRDGKPSESKISFDVMTGRHYFNMLKQLTKQIRQ